MLFETINQMEAFFVLFFGGLFMGALAVILNLFAPKNKYFRWTYDFVGTLCFCLCFFILNLFANFGEFRLFTIISFILGILCAYFFKKVIKLCLKQKKNKKEG